MEVWARAGVRLKNSICEQAISAYPIQSLIAGIDTFTYDNVLVDGNGALLFVDNGASFDYRACGKPKGWFWERRDPDDPVTGYLSLVRHPDQYVLKEILFGIKGRRWDQWPNFTNRFYNPSWVRPFQSDVAGDSIMTIEGDCYW